MDLGAALISLVTVGVVKLAVMTIAGGLLVKLYGTVYGTRTRRLWLLLPDARVPEIRWLWWALLLFAVSELTCGVEIWVLFRSSATLGIIHSFSSALGMGLFVFAAYAYLDKKLFGFAARACIGNRICRSCPVREGAACNYRSLLQLVASFVGLAAVPPLFASTAELSAEPRKYLLPFPSLNAWYDDRFSPWLQSVYPGNDPSGVAYSIPSAVQIVDFRVLPAIVLGLSVIAIALLQRRREKSAVLVQAFAVGVLAYAYCELVLYRATGDVLLGSLAHEVVEFWFLLLTAEFLVRTFGVKDAKDAKEEAR